MQKLKEELVKHIESADSINAAKVIESIVNDFNEEEFYTAFGSASGNFNDHPVMAALMNGNKEIFDLMMKNIPGLDKNLHRAVSSNHRLINIAVLPCAANGKVNEEKLRNAHVILDKIYESLSWDEKKGIGLFMLCSFFLHERKVDAFLQEANFAEVANQKGYRSATAINFVASTWDKDERSKNIFNKLFNNKFIFDALNQNESIISNLINTSNLDALSKMNITDEQMRIYWPVLVGLFSTSTDRSDVLESLCRKFIGAQKDYRFLSTLDGAIQSMNPEIQQMIVSSILESMKGDLKSGKVSLEGIYKGEKGLDVPAENFVNMIALDDSYIRYITLPESDKKFLQERKAILDSENKVVSDNVTKQKEKLKTFELEVLNAERVWYHTLRRGVDFPQKEEKQMPFGHSAEDEERRAEVLKRVFLTIGGCGLQVRKDKNSEWVDANKNGLPLAMEVGIGARVLIEIPKIKNQSEEHKFFNWMTCGSPNDGSYLNTNVSNQTSGLTTLADGKIIQTRTFATHGLKVGKDGHLEEEKLGQKKPVGTATMLLTGAANNLGLAEFTGHFGMNVGVGKYGDFDVKGKTVRPDGATGHLYMYYKPPTTAEPGGILLGMEGSEPHVDGQFGSHSMTGASDPLTVAGGRQSKELAEMQKAGEYKDSFIADRYNGRRVILTPEMTKELYEVDLSKITNPGIMAIVKPQRNVHEFNVIATTNVEHGKSKKAEDTLCTFEVLTSPENEVLGESSKRKLLDALQKLSIERNDTLTPAELFSLKAEYREIFQIVFDALKAHHVVEADKKIEDFRVSVEEYVASFGRNNRHNLVFEAHKEVLNNANLEKHGNPTAPRVYGVGLYFWKTLEDNKTQGLGMAPRLTPSALNAALGDIINASGKQFEKSKKDVSEYLEDTKTAIIDRGGKKKLIISPTVCDIADEDKGTIRFAQSGAVNIGDVLRSVVQDEESKKKFLNGELEIAMPYAQSLNYSNYIPFLNRGHFTMLHVKFDKERNKIIATNFDSKNSSSTTLYPIDHIRPWFQEMASNLGEGVKFRLESKSLGWQPVMNNKDCGRFVLVMLKKVLMSSVDELGTMKANDAIKEVCSMAKNDEEKLVTNIIAEHLLRVDEHLKNCILKLYTNTLTPSQEEVGKNLEEYKNVLNELLKGDEITKEKFEGLRCAVEKLLGEAGRNRRLRGVYSIHCEVMEGKGWGRPEMAYPISWGQTIKDVVTLPVSMLWAFGSITSGIMLSLTSSVAKLYNHDTSSVAKISPRDEQKILDSDSKEQEKDK